jgi:hypothetical protein
MINTDRNITLRPYKFYKNDPSKSIDVGYGENLYGKFLKFQVLDCNAGEHGTNTGFAYLNVHTNIPLKVNDCVMVDEILYVQVKRTSFNKTATIIGITIKQTNPDVIMKETSEDEFSMPDFEV